MYISQKIFNNILVTILKVKVSITLNTSTNVWICIFDYSKALISIMITLKTNKLRSLFSDTDSLMCEIKRKMFMKVLLRISKCLILTIIQINQINQYYKD